MFSLEAEAYRKSKLPPPEAIEAPKIPGPLAGKPFKFGQTNGGIRALNGQPNVSGTSFPPSNIPRPSMVGREWPPNGSYTQNGPPPGSFRQPMSAGALPPRPNVPPGNSRQPMPPDGRLPPTINPPRPNFQPPPQPPNSFRSNTQPPIYGQAMSPATPPNNDSFGPNRQPGTFRQAIGPGAVPPNTNSFRPNLQPRTFGQPVGPGVVPSNNGYTPGQQQGNTDQEMRSARSFGPDALPSNVRPVGALSSDPRTVPFENSMIQSYEESLRIMTNEKPRFPAATSQQQGLQYKAPTYTEPPPVSPPSTSETKNTWGPPRTQLFKSDALSSAAKGDSSFLDQIEPAVSTRTSTEIVSPESMPGVRPFPKPESFSFSPNTPIAQFGKSAVEQSWTRDDTEQQQPFEEETTRSWSQPESIATTETNDRTTSPDPIPYSSETSLPRYQSSPYNMPDPTKRRSYLDQLGPS